MRETAARGGGENLLVESEEGGGEATGGDQRLYHPDRFVLRPRGRPKEFPTCLRKGKKRES